MPIERWILGIGIVIAAGIQYGLVYYSLRDLARRPTVRGNNRIGWGLIILTLPFAGALIYSTVGPTSFLPRPNRPPRASISTLDENDLQ
jgi:Phospholipase_D-nuclease N-terminal